MESGLYVLCYVLPSVISPKEGVKARLVFSFVFPPRAPVALARAVFLSYSRRKNISLQVHCDKWQIQFSSPQQRILWIFSSSDLATPPHFGAPTGFRGPSDQEGKSLIFLIFRSIIAFLPFRPRKTHVAALIVFSLFSQPATRCVASSPPRVPKLSLKPFLFFQSLSPNNFFCLWSFFCSNVFPVFSGAFR